MKRFSQYILASCLALSALGLTGCADETVPTSGATKEEAESSVSAMVNGISAYLNNYDSSWSRSRHWAWAYGSMMVIRDIQSGDRVHTDANYDQYYYFGRNLYMSQNYVFMQYVWYYYYGLVNAANNVIGLVDESTADDAAKGSLGAAYAFRALAYLDLARSYEYLPTANTSPITDAGNDVSGLTVPIVTEKTDEAAARNNPRAPRDSMFAFILSDLDKAEQYIGNLTDRNGGQNPDLACVYGLKARLYMWVENYAKAKEYARLAIDNTKITPMSESDCLSPLTGFNDISKWMWGASQNSENGLVQTGIVNWASWSTNQTYFGYTGLSGSACPTVMINRNIYDAIANTDFRKAEFVPADLEEPVAPEEGAEDYDEAYAQYVEDSIQYVSGLALAERVQYIPGTEDDCKALGPYTALKFRPAQGNTAVYTTACATSYPLMRVEEMYLIEAEAAAHLNVAEGRQLINSFMQTYRDESYNCTYDDQEALVYEIVLQKRIELWGEGQSFFDIKRLNLSVTKNYPGTNVPDVYKQNTDGRPAWMNYCIVVRESNSNAALDGWNNPDPSGKES